MEAIHFTTIALTLLGVFSLVYGLLVRQHMENEPGEIDYPEETLVLPSARIYQKKGWVKTGLLLITTGALMELWLIGNPFGEKKRFPTEKEFQSIAYQLEHDFKGRIPYDRLSRFLHKIQNPSDVYQTVLVEKFFRFLGDLYQEYEDEAILQAVDNTDISGNTAHFICSFYARVIQIETARNRYRANRLPVQRCIGLSISPEKYKELIE